MHRMIQPKICGGVSHASVRYARANNKLMNLLYNPRQLTLYIMVVFINYLHSGKMSQAMQDGDFK